MLKLVLKYNVNAKKDMDVPTLVYKSKTLYLTNNTLMLP